MNDLNRLRQLEILLAEYHSSHGRYPHIYNNVEGDLNRDWRKELARFFARLNAMPSAQPESEASLEIFSMRDIPSSATEVRAVFAVPGSHLNRDSFLADVNDQIRAPLIVYGECASNISENEVAVTVNSDMSKALTVTDAMSVKILHIVWSDGTIE